MAGWGQSSKIDKIALRQITLTTLHQKHCNSKYNLSGSSGDAQHRQKFLPNFWKLIHPEDKTAQVVVVYIKTSYSYTTL